MQTKTGDTCVVLAGVLLFCIFFTILLLFSQADDIKSLGVNVAAGV